MKAITKGDRPSPRVHASMFTLHRDSRFVTTPTAVSVAVYALVQYHRPE
jgi:hypothetical protein